MPQPTRFTVQSKENPEKRYLEENPDVKKALDDGSAKQQGLFSSAAEHYERYGSKEGRTWGDSDASCVQCIPGYKVLSTENRTTLVANYRIATDIFARAETGSGLMKDKAEISKFHAAMSPDAPVDIAVAKEAIDALAAKTQNKTLLAELTKASEALSKMQRVIDKMPPVDRFLYQTQLATAHSSHSMTPIIMDEIRRQGLDDLKKYPEHKLVVERGAVRAESMGLQQLQAQDPLVKRAVGLVFKEAGAGARPDTLEKATQLRTDMQTLIDDLESAKDPFHQKLREELTKALTEMNEAEKSLHRRIGVGDMKDIGDRLLASGMTPAGESVPRIVPSKPTGQTTGVS